MEQQGHTSAQNVAHLAFLLVKHESGATVKRVPQEFNVLRKCGGATLENFVLNICLSFTTFHKSHSVSRTSESLYSAKPRENQQGERIPSYPVNEALLHEACRHSGDTKLCQGRTVAAEAFNLLHPGHIL